MAKWKVLYILGSNRCGSTLVSTILNGFQGFVSVGEIRYFWERGLQLNWLCSCGRTFSECPYWGKIAPRVIDMMAVSAPPIFSSFAERVLFEKDTQYKLIHLKNRSWFRERYLQQLSTAYETIYTAIGEDGPRVIVDSSKIPQMNLLLRQMSSIDVYYLHIVRDSRAVTYSESFRKKQQISTSHGAKEMSLPLWLSTWRWRRINRQSELLQDGSRFLRIRYESLLKEPEVTLAQILRFVAEDEAAIPQNRVFPVGELHMFSGNPGRMTGPSVTLKPDVEWQERYPQIQRGLVTAATWRQLHRYGYL